MSNSSRKHHREVSSRQPRHTRPDSTAAQPLRLGVAARPPHPSHLSELGADVVATRLRALSHPTRLRMLSALDRRTAGADALADSLGESVASVRAHLSVLYRAGILRRVDDGGRAEYELADWPCLWLIDQFAFRLHERALEDVDLAGDDDQPAVS